MYVKPGKAAKPCSPCSFSSSLSLIINYTDDRNSTTSVASISVSLLPGWKFAAKTFLSLQLWLTTQHPTATPIYFILQLISDLTFRIMFVTGMLVARAQTIST